MFEKSQVLELILISGMSWKYINWLIKNKKNDCVIVDRKQCRIVFVSGQTFMRIDEIWYLGTSDFRHFVVTSNCTSKCRMTFEGIGEQEQLFK